MKLASHLVGALAWCTLVGCDRGDTAENGHESLVDASSERIARGHEEESQSVAPAGEPSSAEASTPSVDASASRSVVSPGPSDSGSALHDAGVAEELTDGGRRRVAAPLDGGRNRSHEVLDATAAGSLDAMAPDAAGLTCEPQVPLRDGGFMACVAPELADLSSDDSALTLPDAGGACLPFTNGMQRPAPDFVDAGNDATACFPECVAELEAQCYPTGECVQSFEDTSVDVACWNNGVRRTSSGISLGTSFFISTTLHSGANLCYSVEIELPPSGDGVYTWRDACGHVIATGQEDPERPAFVTVTCRDGGEPTLVDTGSPACAQHADGAPWFDTCNLPPACAL